MALQAGQGGGNYMDRDEWLALGRESALVALVLNGWTETEVKKGRDVGKMLPTAKIDVFVLSGSRKGEVLRGEQVFGKGLVTPLEREQVGGEVAYLLGTGQNGGTEYVQANAPGDHLTDQAIALFESLKTGEGESKAAPKAETSAKTSTKAASKSKAADDEKVPAGVGARSSDDDDMPDF